MSGGTMRCTSLLVVGVLAVACCPFLNTPKRSFEQMRDRACAGDVPGFFAYVDKTALTKNTVPGPLGSIAMSQVFTEWEDEVKKGKDGYTCRLETLGSSESWVDLRRVSGNRSRWHFERHDSKHLLVKIEQLGK